METLNELVKLVKHNIDNEFVKLKETPKRCALKEIHGFINVPGYLVTFYYTEHDYTDSLFISDIENTLVFHEASSVFCTDYFRFRCRWVSSYEVDLRESYGFYV